MTTTAAKTIMIKTAMTETTAKVGTADGDDTASDGKTCRVTVFDWLPNSPTTLHVYSKSLVSVATSVSSRTDPVPFFIILPSVSNHCIVLLAKSVVQFNAARVP